MSFKKVIFISLIVLFSVSISGLVLKNRIQTPLKELFRLNKTLQEEGYYMAEFEFKMMGILYWLDKGQYAKATSTLSHYHSQLMNRENLIKLPKFRSTEDELQFYLNLQNPKTGAFMDDTFPFCTFNEPTENVINHLDELAKSLGVPLQLKYPLKYLDQINTVEKLYAFLDDVSYIGWLGSRFPETTFVFARSLLSYWNNEGVIAQNKLYHFPDDYKTALLQWFYTHQDSTSGYWGPMSGDSNRLVKIDLNNTASVIKAFIDKQGDNIHISFPLKYRDKIITTTLDLVDKPLPAEDELDEWHAWNVSMKKGLKMLLRYLWKYASDENRQRTKTVIENYIKIKFEKYYIPNEGAFSYYPNAKHASLDGTGGFIYQGIGAYSTQKQEMLWGNTDTHIKDLGFFKKSMLTKKDWDLIINNPGINSLRLYNEQPDWGNLTDSVFALVYPNKTAVLDVMELVPKITAWLDSVDLSIGNWTSREHIQKDYAALNIEEPLIFREAFPLESINRMLREKNELHIIGFDILQIPRYKIVYTYSAGI